MSPRKKAFFYPFIFVSIIYLSCTPSFSEVEIKTVRLGYMTKSYLGVDIRDARVALKMLTEKIFEKSLQNIQLPTNVKYTLDVKMYDDVQSFVQAIDRQEIDVANINSVDYLAMKDGLQLEPAIITTSGEEPLTTYVFLVRNESTISQLMDLRQKRLIVERSNDGTLGMFWLNTLLYQNSLPEAKTFLSSIKIVDKFSQAVLSVFFGQADFCIVSESALQTMIDLNPQIEQRTKILFRSPGLITQVFCFNENLDVLIKNNIKTAITTLPDTPEGKQMLLLLRANRLFLYEPEYLNGLETLYNEYAKFKNKKNLFLDDLIQSIY